MGNEDRIVQIAQRSALSVFVVDRDSMSSDLLVGALSRDRRYEAAALEPATLLKVLGERKVDVVVIGANSSPQNGVGLSLVSAVHRSYPSLYMVVLLDEPSHEQVIGAFRSGARGVFSRKLPMSDFYSCIEQVAKGSIWAGQLETKSIIDALKTIPTANSLLDASAAGLTKREFEVVQSAAKGKTNKTIANELFLSEHTVKNYLFRAFEKLGVSSRVELLFYLTVRGHRFSSVECEEI